MTDSIAVDRKRLIIALEDDSNSSSDDESDGITIIHILNTMKRSRVSIKNYYEEVIPHYSDIEFITHFRLSKQKVSQLVQQFSESDTFQNLSKDPRSHSTNNAEKSILLFLWFAGHQTTSFRDIGDRFDVSISSVHALITRVSLFLSYMSKDVIKMSSNEEKLKTAEFYNIKSGFPNVIGCIDGTHIRIDKPSERHTDYCNRKDYYSIILQGVCNENLQFIDVFIGYPGSVHDARVFNNSSISSNLSDTCGGNCILGDSAYPLSQHLITPFKDNGHLTAAQKHFNKQHASCRVAIENTFGLLKQRFRQLYHLKLRGHERICHFIRACCVLHNIANADDITMFVNEEVLPDIQPDHHHNRMETNRIGVQLRNEICTQLFLGRR